MLRAKVAVSSSAAKALRRGGRGREVPTAPPAGTLPVSSGASASAVRVSRYLRRAAAKTRARIRTILRTNINTAYSAGRYRRQRETVAARPYWQYTAVLDGSTRPSHRDLHGRIWRADDPIWDSIYPPNGFNCRCRVRALPERQVLSRGLDVLEGDAGLGGFTPDVGWNYAPGAHGLIRDPDLGARAVSGQPTWRELKRPDLRNLPRAPGPPLLDAAPSTDQARRTVELALGLTDDVSRRMVQTPVEDVLLSRDRVTRITYKFSDHRERFANRILPTLLEPSEVWMTYYDNGEYRKRYIKVFEGEGREGRAGFAIAEEVPGGAVLFNFIPKKRADLNRQRVGQLLYPKEEGERGTSGRPRGSVPVAA